MSIVAGRTLPSVPTTNNGPSAMSNTSRVSPCLKLISSFELPLFVYLTNSKSDSISLPYAYDTTVAVIPEESPDKIVPTRFPISYFWNITLPLTFTATSDTEDNFT